MYRSLFGIPDEIGDMTRSLDIGRLYSDFGKVPSDSGIFRSTGELREFAGEKYWALLGHTEKREGLPRAGRAPPQGLVRIGLGGGAAPPPSFPSLFPFLVSYSYYMEGLLVGLGKRESYSRWE